jgi:hypothetical protein
MIIYESRNLVFGQHVITGELASSIAAIVVNLCRSVQFVGLYPSRHTLINKRSENAAA